MKVNGGGGGCGEGGGGESDWSTRNKLSWKIPAFEPSSGNKVIKRQSFPEEPIIVHIWSYNYENDVKRLFCLEIFKIL